MKLIKILRTVIVAMFIALVVPVTLHASDSKSSYNLTARDPGEDAKTYSRIVTRLSEIQSMDKSNLSKAEKKKLRKELQEMKKAADGLNSRVYLSVGAIIIIILLLILILR